VDVVTFGGRSSLCRRVGMAGSQKALVTLHEMNPGRIDSGESLIRSRVEVVGEFGRLRRAAI
jgi:hypothetical protein